VKSASIRVSMIEVHTTVAAVCAGVLQHSILLQIRNGERDVSESGQLLPFVAVLTLIVPQRVVVDNHSAHNTRCRLFQHLAT
jgi:hypothetical protein